MICPHCKKAISYNITPECFARAGELKTQGYSLRDIEKILMTEGHQASFSNLSKHFRKRKGKQK